MKNRTIKTLTSLVLAIMMVATLVPAMFIGAFAAETTVTLSFAGGSGTNLDPIEFTDDASGVSASFTSGTHTTKPRWDSTGVRFYGTADKTNNLTVTAPENATITQIVFTMNGSSYNMNSVSVDSGSINASTYTWTGDASSVVFTTSAQTRFASAAITYKTEDGTPVHTHDYAWNGVTGAEGSHTVVCSNEDDLCTALSKFVDCEWNDGEETETATCTAEGEMTYTCTVCSATKVEAIPVAAHDYVDGVCSVCQAVMPLEFPFDYTSGTNATAPADVTDGPVLITFGAGTNTSNSPKFYTSGTAVRFYANNTLTIEAAAGYYIASVALTITQQSFTADDGTVLDATNGVWTPDMKGTKSVVFTYVATSGNVRVSAIVVTLEKETDCPHTNVVAIGTPADPTCTEAGITAGKFCNDCETAIEPQETIPALGHAWDGTDCTVCDATRSFYTKVDVADLKDGDGIVIYHPTSGNLISGTANGNKLAGDAATVTDTTIASNSGEELFLVVRVDANGDYYFQTEDGLYLTTGATGNSLTLETELTDYAKWYFDTSAGLYIVSRNAKYNSNTQALEYYNNFTVYGLSSGGDAFNFEIYKKEGYSNPTAPVNTQYSLSLKGDIGVNIYYYVTDTWFAANEGATITINGETKALVAGHNAYTFNISPADLDKKIEYFLSTDPTAITTVTAQGYIDYIVANSADFDANLVALVASLSAYGKAAYAFNNNTAFETVTYNEGVEAYVNGFANAEKVNGELVEWTGISAIIYSRNAIVVYYNDLGLAADATYSIEANSYEISGKLSDIKADGSIIISGIAAYDLDTVFTVTIGDNASREVCLMNYIYAQKDSTGALQSLVVALANYSFAANTYFGK